MAKLSTHSANGEEKAPDAKKAKVDGSGGGVGELSIEAQKVCLFVCVFL
jgi:hypothetical protein